MNTLHTVQLLIPTMRCASCSTRVSQALKSVPGVASVAVNPANKTATVGSTIQDLDEVLITVLAAAGYPAERQPPVVA